MNALLAHGLFTDLRESTKGVGRGSAILIKAGRNSERSKSPRVWPAAVLKEAVEKGMFEGRYIFRNHQPEDDFLRGKDRDERDKVGRVENVTFSESLDAVVGDVVIFDPDMLAKLRTAKEVGALDAQELSLWAHGPSHRESVDDGEGQVQIVDGITSVHSLDFVFEGGAAGRMILFESITADNLKEHRPDLFDSIRESIAGENDKEAQAMTEKELKEALDKVTEDKVALEKQLQESRSENAKVRAKAELQEALDKSELNAEMKAFVAKRYEGAEHNDAFAESLTADIEEATKLQESLTGGKGSKSGDTSHKESNKQKLGGVGDDTPHKSDEHASLTESIRNMRIQRYMDNGKTKEEAEKMALVG